MNVVDWLITVVPLVFILGVAFYSKRFVHGVVDYLAAGRVAGRYVISVGDMTSGLSVIVLVALVEAKYQVGYALSFWEFLLVPVSIIMSLTGYCVYRFRETRSLSIGQFLEMRYSRSLRIVAASLRTISEMITNAIGPAVAANFFIYFIGLPHKIVVLGVPLPTFALIVLAMLLLAILVIWPGGRVSLLITDSFQGLMSYPIFVIIAGYILIHFGWNESIAPVMMDRVAGENFLNPFDIEKLRDFNIFALFVTIMGNVLNRASWIGNDASTCGRTPHEQKMAGVLGAWRNGFGQLMCLLVAIMIVTLMTHERFADKASDIRQQLSRKVGQETVADPALQNQLTARISDIPIQRHQIGVDPPLSRQSNLDTAYMQAARETLGTSPEGNLLYQKFYTLYHQMMLPVALRNLLPVGLMGLFCLLMIMLMLSTDDARIFNSSSTIMQDIILPLRKKPLTPKEHLLWLRICSLSVAAFFFVVSMFFVQLDYIQMFVTIMTAIWLGGAGPIMVFGLYSRFGTATGAFCSLIFGSGFSVAGLFCQRNWAATIYPWLHAHGWDVPLSVFLRQVSAPFEPYISWTVNPVKFPINSYELYFLSMVFGIMGYVIGSLLTRKQPYDLDRLLHRGSYNINGEHKEPFSWSVSHILDKIVGITPEYTRGDRIIAWSVVGYAIIYKFCLCFLAVLIWNLISPWPSSWWSTYFFITSLIVTSLIGVISTVWFLIGGVIDLRKLFRDLSARIDNPLDDGRVDGNVSLVDKEVFDRRLRKTD